MAPNEEPQADTSRAPSDKTQALPNSQHKNASEQVRTSPLLVHFTSRLITVSPLIVQRKKTDNTSAFSHPGARSIAQRAADGDGPYRCRKCGDAVITVSVQQCPACLDNYPWLGPADDEEHA